MSGTNENIADLRSHLFGALRGLSDKSMDIDRAKAIADVGQTIINSAKVEVDYMKVSGGPGSGFIAADKKPVLPNGSAVIDQKPGVTVTRHTLK